NTYLYNTSPHTLSLHDALPIFTGNSYDNTGQLGASTWRHVAFIEQEVPAHLAAASPVPDTTLHGSDAAASGPAPVDLGLQRGVRDRKSTRLNSSHVSISYAVFC